MATILTFGNQKGGVGKTTLTNQLAMYIHNKTDYSVVVMDGDELQHSLSSTREHEKNVWLKSMQAELLGNGQEWNDDIKKLFGEKYDEQCYPLKSKNASNMLDGIKNSYESYDFILLDMPGSLIGEGIIGIYALVDYLFVPMDVTFKDMDSTQRFLDMYNARIKPKREELNFQCNVYGVFNKLKEGSIDFKTRYDQVKEKGITIPFLNSYITDTAQLKREDSTVEMIMLEKLKNPEMLQDFCKEVIDVMLNNQN